MLDRNCKSKLGERRRNQGCVDFWCWVVPVSSRYDDPKLVRLKEAPERVSTLFGAELSVAHVDGEENQQLLWKRM